jgi:hypothetical protein
VPKSSKRKHETRRANRDRKQRLEELRTQQKAAERRKNFLFAGTAIVVALLLIGAAVVPTIIHDRNQKAKEKVGYQAAPTAAEKAAGCLGVHNDPLSAQALHVDGPIDYSKEPYGDSRDGTPAIPPTGGKHNALSLGDTVRFYPLSQKPRPERAVHNLEHGYIVVWYDSKLPADQVKKLQELAKSGSMTRLLVVGWWQSDLPADHHVVFTSWGRTDRCTTVSDAMASEFYQAHLNADIAPEAGSAPIQGADQLDPGKLPTAQPSSMPSGQPSAQPSAQPTVTASFAPTKKK